MKKLLIAVSMLGLFAFSGCVVEDDCECLLGDAATCVNDLDLAYGCSNDCDWDYIDDCDAECYLDGYSGGYCELGVVEDYCVCE